MASKYGMKSKIPVIDLKKELSTKTVGMTLTNSKQIKPLENKEKTTVKKNICGEMSREVKQSKANAEKVTTKGKTTIAKKVLLQKPNKEAVGSTITTLSKEMVTQLKIEKLHDCKSNTEAIDVSSDKTDGITSKPTSGERKTSPSLIVQPKKYVPHGGLMFKPTKSAVGFKPFHFEPGPAKLRRSQSEYDPDFERPKPENIVPQQKCIIIAQKDKADQNIKLAKSSTLSKHKELSSRVEQKFRKDIPAQSKNPLVPTRMPKNASVENKPAKTQVKSKPLRRSSTINAFDSARPKPENARLQQKDINIIKNCKADQKIKSSILSKHQEKSSAIANKIPKDIPQVHSNNQFVPQRISKNVSGENKPPKSIHLKSKPLRRSNTIHAFDSAPVLNKAFGIRKKEPINSKRIAEQVSFENETPGTPENLKLPQLDVEDIDKQLTPKKEIPHAGLVFKLHATRRGNENKIKPFANVN